MTASAFVDTMPSIDVPRAAPMRVLAWIRSLGWHGVWIATWAVVSWVATISSPGLLSHPELLMLLAPRAAFVVLAAPHLGFLPFVALGTARLAMTDASWYIVGKRFPERAGRRGTLSRIRGMGWIVRVTTCLCRWLCSTALLAGMVLFFRPNGRYLGVAGAHGVDSRIAGASSIAGTVAYLVAVHLGVATFF